jgi:uncharacterized membrane protein YdfJ with MMPL/SSD domain/pSer/pThr/pTyr-binding forkhead associated (FHA) protein
MAGLRLKVLSGPAEGATIPLGGDPLSIGRAEAGAGTLGDDPELSRRHAQVFERDGRLFVEDLGSTNGTFVNGNRIQGRIELGPGDKLVVGSTAMELEGPARVEEGGAALEVVSGPGKGLRLALGPEPVVIGREEEGDGKLGDDPELSRRHARVYASGGRIAVDDLGSLNGTYVNGRRIDQATELEPGDKLWLGNTTLMVTTDDHPAPAMAPSSPPPPSAEGRLLSRVADFTMRRPKRLLAAIGVFFLIAAGVGGSVADVLAENATGFEDPASEAVKTEERIADVSGEFPGAQLIVLVRAGRPVASAAVRRRVEGLRKTVERDPLVTRTLSFYDTGNRAFVSRDRRSTFIAAFFKDSDEAAQEDAAKRILDRVQDPPEVLVGGGATSGFQVGERVGEDLGKAEGLALPILFLVSIFVFRGFVAALLPMFVGILTIFTTFFVLRLVNEAVPLSQFALNIVIGLGLGLSIDYSLFVVSRYREERMVAASEAEALRRAVLSAGRTILYSAATVAVALATLITFPQGFLYSMGIGGLVTSLAAVTVSLIALPALLALLGSRVNSLAPARWKRAAERTARREQEGPWYRLSRAVMRRPIVFAVTSALVLIVMGLPALGIEFTGITIKSAPSDLSARQVDDALRRDFDVNLSEITVLARAPRSEAERVRRFAADLQELPGASQAATQPPRPLRGGLWELTITPAGGTLDDRTKALVERIRDGPSPFPVSVTGQTAHFLDQKESIGSHLPLSLALLCGATLVVLFLMTGSVILPLKSLLMNALSLTAAFGLLVLIFQDGRLEGLLGFESEGAIELSQPVLLFALAFGLSTDYAVFLLSRIKEARTTAASETDAVAIGLERTGRIVTQAAILFCIAIGAFATSSVIFIKEVGVGTALAVLIDASIVRAFLVPSLMALLGSRNWWAPAWLRRVHQRIGLSEA